MVRPEPASDNADPGVVWPRLLIGLVVLACAEVFSGASLAIGLWHPWTLVVTYWLYFAHFFLFTTLAVRTGRTSLASLYLWGIPYGLYESWITKVVWFGYAGDGKLAMGRIGPYGLSELTMVLFFHPVMAFLLPLAVACLLCPPLRALFPDLAWMSGPSRGARAVRAWLVASFAPVIGMNGGGPVNVVMNYAFLGVVAAVLWRLSRRGLAAPAPDAWRIVGFGRRGLVGLVAYLAGLYALGYRYLRPEGLPATRVQLATFGFYAVALAGLALQRRREPEPGRAVVAPIERRRAAAVLAGTLGLGLGLSFAAGTPVVFVPVVIDFVVWVALSAALPLAAIGAGVAGRRRAIPSAP